MEVEFGVSKRPSSVAKSYGRFRERFHVSFIGESYHQRKSPGNDNQYSIQYVDYYGRAIRVGEVVW